MTAPWLLLGAAASAFAAVALLLAAERHLARDVPDWLGALFAASVGLGIVAVWLLLVVPGAVERMAGG